METRLWIAAQKKPGLFLGILGESFCKKSLKLDFHDFCDGSDWSAREKTKTSAGISEQSMGARNRVVEPPRQLLAGRYCNPILTRFLALIDCSKLPAQLSNKNAKYKKKLAKGYCLTLWKRVVTEISSWFLHETDPFCKFFVIRDL